jgi:glycosyltransferase involved in cell wall biosynthesis
MLVLILAPYPPNNSPSQRFRFEHYLEEAKNHQIKITYCSFTGIKTWKIMFLKGKQLAKVAGICKGFIKRFMLLFSILKYDFVYIHREAAPIGPPIFEWLIAKVFKRKIIYDFDDAIWVSIASEANPRAAAIKCTWKVAKICKMSHIVTVGNQFLADYAKKYCSDVRIIPTVVNTSTKHNSLKNQTDTPLFIGWTGTYTNFYNLDKITSVLKELKKKYDFTFIIIADKDPKFEDLEYVFKKWNVDTEIFDLLQMHIGVMPLQNTEIELGKCAFKAIQYMSLGIPAVVSPVGANCTVVQNGVDGFWAETDEDWYNKLELLIKDETMRVAIGNAARKKIVEQYSVDATQGMFFNLFTKSA